MLRTIWKWLAASFSVVVILLAIGIGLFRLLLPFVPQYHERIEAFASEAAGTPVRIEGIDARWGLAGPQLRFRNAELLTPDASETLLSAANGSVVLDFGALIKRREFRAGQILLEGLRLEVVRDAQGEWRIGGRALGDGGSVPQRLSIGLRESEVLFRDEVNGTGPLIFEEVDLNVELQGERLSIGGAFNLPGELGGELEVSLQADGNLAEPDTLSWQVYAGGTALELGGWSALLPIDRTVPAAGQGDAVVWVALDGSRLQQASVQLELSNVELVRGAEPVRTFDRLAGRFEFDTVDSGWRASGNDIDIVSNDLAWPAATFHIEQVGASSGNGLLYADFDYARLQDVLPFIDWLPNETSREWLAQLRPRGIVEDFSFRMVRDQGAIERYSLRSRFAGLGIDAAKGLPGFAGARGNLRMDNVGGRLQLDPENVTLDLSGILGKPLETRRLDGVIVWRQSGNGWRVLSDNVDLDHDAFRSSTSFELTLPDDGGSPSLDLSTSLADVGIAKLRGLIPSPILRPKLRDWLDNALIGGTIPVATVNWSGAFDRFPFDEDDGVFRIAAEFRDVEMAYARGWPVARAMDGTVNFVNTGLAAGISGGEISGNRVSSASISIDDLRDSVLMLRVSADGMLERLHGFLKSTPLIKSDNDPLARMTFSGIGSTEVNLTLPLKKNARSDVAVTVSTEAGEIALQGLAHRLENVEGNLRYRNGEFYAQGMTALVLGAPVLIDVSPELLNTQAGARRATVAKARGVLSDRELARLDDSLASLLEGSTAYTATLTLPENGAGVPVSIEVASRLEGMTVSLPAPLNKAAGTPENLNIFLTLPSGGAVAAVNYGDLANARLSWTHVEGGPWLLERGGIHFGTTPARLPAATGIEISGSAARVDVGGWLALGASFASGDGGDAGNLASIRLRALTLDAFGQEIDNAVVTLDRSEREWLIQIDSEAVSGALFVPFGLKQPIIANMERLHIGIGDKPGDAGAVPDPGAIPEIDLRIDDFRLGDMALGVVTCRLRKTATGIALEQFVSEAGSFGVAGTGSWQRVDLGQETRLDLKLISTDLAPTLVSLGFDASIDADDAQIDFSLNWPGPPGPEFKQELNGEVKVRVGAGQLRAVQPGAGRVFGLLSFTALPRRLSLDFRDVFDKGFGFDFIEGDFALVDGDAFTSNLLLEGPAAQVGIAGRAGLVARDYDQTAVVYGNFGAALPVAGAIAGGPVGGAAMLIFSELFKKPLQDMARANYRITGSWDEPAIERVLATSSGAGAL